jgi:hypothetical protein
VTDEQQIAALREEIRRAGRQTATVRDRWRLWLAAGVFAFLFLPGAVQVLLSHRYATEAAELTPYAALLAAVLAAAAGLAVAPMVAAK